jgi:HD-like signal output (HDOD) protein
MLQIFSRQSAAAAVAPAPAAAAPAAAPPAGAPPELPNDAAVEASLTDMLRQRVARLEHELATARDAGDAPALLAGLASGGASQVRQPPAAAQRALAVCRNPDCSQREVVRLLEGNPTLTHALLKSANSIYYSSGGAPCVSLGAAVQRVGIRGVYNVVLESTMEGMLCRPGAGYDALVEQVWSHMVRTAPVTRTLSRAFDVGPDEAFALGLLHDIGKLVLFDRISGMRNELRRGVAVPAPLLSRMLRELHEPLGGLAVLRWGLGATAGTAVSAHHRTVRVAHPAPDRLSESIYLAERVDIAQLSKRPMALDEWWTAGALTGSRERAEELLAAVVAAAAGEGAPARGR